MRPTLGRIFLFWRGRATRVGMLESKPPVEPIASTLEKLVSQRVRGAANSPLLAWSLACGSAVAARTNAVAFARGVLWIEVPDAGWRAELQELAARYLATVNRHSGNAVDRIEFVAKKDARANNAEVQKRSTSEF